MLLSDRLWSGPGYSNNFFSQFFSTSVVHLEAFKVINRFYLSVKSELQLILKLKTRNVTIMTLGPLRRQMTDVYLHLRRTI